MKIKYNTKQLTWLEKFKAGMIAIEGNVQVIVDYLNSIGIYSVSGEKLDSNRCKIDSIVAYLTRDQFSVWKNKPNQTIFVQELEQNPSRRLINIGFNHGWPKHYDTIPRIHSLEIQKLIENEKQTSTT